MAILDGDNGRSDQLGDGDSDQSGQAEKPNPKVSSEGPGSQNRTGETPERKKDRPRPLGSTFGKYTHRIGKPVVGYPCLHCVHTHMDHSQYSPKCLIEGCDCIGLKIDVNLIPGRFKA